MLNVVSLTESGISLRYVRRQFQDDLVFCQKLLSTSHSSGQCGTSTGRKGRQHFFFFLPVMTDCVVAEALEGVQVLAAREQFITSLTQSSVPPPIKLSGPLLNPSFWQLPATHSSRKSSVISQKKKFLLQKKTHLCFVFVCFFVFLKGFPGDIGMPGPNGPPGPKVLPPSKRTSNHACVIHPINQLNPCLSLHFRVCKVPEDHQAHQGHKEHRWDQFTANFPFSPQFLSCWVTVLRKEGNWKKKKKRKAGLWLKTKKRLNCGSASDQTSHSCSFHLSSWLILEGVRDRVKWWSII